MNVAFAPKNAVWRGPGHPRRQIPPQVMEMADRTYRTGQVGMVEIESDEEEEATELVRLLKSYAKARGCRMRIQRDDSVLRFEMCDTKGSAPHALRE